MFNWLIGFIVFWAGVYAIYRVWISSEEVMVKILWTALIALLPVIGLVIWWFAGPNGRRV